MRLLVSCVVTVLVASCVLSTVSGQDAIPVPGSPFLMRSPTGTFYDSRTYRYDRDSHRVVKKDEFIGLSWSQRNAAARHLGLQIGGENPAKFAAALQRREVVRQQRLENRRENLRAKYEAGKTLIVSPSGHSNGSSSYSSSSTSSAYHANNLEAYIRAATVHIHTKDYSGEGAGSGVVTIILGRKYVLTANHVIQGAIAAKLTALGDNSQGLVNRADGWNFVYDVAAIPLPRNMYHLPAVPLLNGTVPPGQKIMLSGFPGGSYYHITNGVVGGYINGNTELLHTAPSSSGASGGMIITPAGHLCGIHTHAYKPSSRYYPFKGATPSHVILELIRRNTR